MDKRCKLYGPDVFRVVPTEDPETKQAQTSPCTCRRYKEGDLNVGENSCVDRCASKYWQVTGIVGQMLGGAGQ